MLKFALATSYIGLYHHHIAHCFISQCAFLVKKQMTKQLITQAIFESANIRHKDADALASVVLVAIRDEIINKGELSLPGVGTFVVGPRPRKITKADLVNVIRSSGEITREDASFSVDLVMDVAKFIAESKTPYAFFNMGEFAPCEAYPSQIQRVVRFKASPLLLGGLASAEKGAGIDQHDSAETKAVQGD
jgi:nucleoid DNA-binding protein